MSENAKKVALEVMAEVGKGRIPKKGEIIRKNGYSKRLSWSPKKVTETKDYQNTIKPFLEKLIEQREEAIKELPDRIGKANYRDLVDSIDKFTKNIQLLSGGDTEKSNITVKWE